MVFWGKLKKCKPLGHLLSTHGVCLHTVHVYFTLIYILHLNTICMLCKCKSKWHYRDAIHVNNFTAHCHIVNWMQKINFTLSILFSIKSSKTWMAVMFFPLYCSSPPCTGRSINTSKQDTGRLLSRLTAWLRIEKKKITYNLISDERAKGVLLIIVALNDTWKHSTWQRGIQSIVVVKLNRNIGSETVSVHLIYKAPVVE